MSRGGPALHAIDSGPRGAPAVVLLHSIATHAGLWSPQLPVWSTHLRVLALDLPGHGESAVDPALARIDSYADRVAQALDERGIERCALVGLSLGGMIGQAFALHYPQRLRALVLANTSAQTPPPLREIWETRKARALREGLEPQVAGTLERWFPADFARRAPLTLDWVAAMIRRTAPQGYACAATAIQSLATFERLPEIRCPTLVIAGAHDGATTPDQLRQLAARIPGAQFLLLEAAGHLSNLAEATAFTEQVGAFLRATA